MLQESVFRIVLTAGFARAFILGLRASAARQPGQPLPAIIALKNNPWD
jgi:hypothetical protein